MSIATRKALGMGLMVLSGASAGYVITKAVARSSGISEDAGDGKRKINASLMDILGLIAVAGTTITATELTTYFLMPESLQSAVGANLVEDKSEEDKANE